jgi:hypothetical protein
LVYGNGVLAQGALRLLLLAARDDFLRGFDSSRGEFLAVGSAGRSGPARTATRRVACGDFKASRSDPGLREQGLGKARGLEMRSVGPVAEDRRGRVACADTPERQGAGLA